MRFCAAVSPLFEDVTAGESLSDLRLLSLVDGFLDSRRCSPCVLDDCFDGLEFISKSCRGRPLSGEEGRLMDPSFCGEDAVKTKRRI